MAAPNSALTRRERDTLTHVCAGLSSKETAIKMGCGARTVEDYRRSIMKKYGARNVVELVRAVYDLDAVDKEKAPE